MGLFGENADFPWDVITCTMLAVLDMRGTAVARHVSARRGCERRDGQGLVVFPEVWPFWQGQWMEMGGRFQRESWGSEKSIFSHCVMIKQKAEPLMQAKSEHGRTAAAVVLKYSIIYHRWQGWHIGISAEQCLVKKNKKHVGCCQGLVYVRFDVARPTHRLSSVSPR